jgi:hypothetical protein
MRSLCVRLCTTAAAAELSICPGQGRHAQGTRHNIFMLPLDVPTSCWGMLAAEPTHSRCCMVLAVPARPPARTDAHAAARYWN